MEKLRTGIFSIGLDTYWPQFDGLYQRLIGYHTKIIMHLVDKDLVVSDCGMVDHTSRGQNTSEISKRQMSIFWSFIS